MKQTCYLGEKLFGITTLSRVTFSRTRLVRMTISSKCSSKSRAVVDPRHSGKCYYAEHHSVSVILLNIMLVRDIMMKKLIFFLMLFCYMGLYICASSQCHSGEYTSVYCHATECHSAQCCGTSSNVYPFSNIGPNP